MANINISQILIKRGNTAAAGNYIGPLGELVVDTGLKTVRVQDGVTPGGMAVLATLSGYNQLSANIANLQTVVSTITGLDTGFISNINTLLSNTVTQQTQINTIGANLSAFQTYANTTFGTSNYGNAQVAAYLINHPQGGLYGDANVAALMGDFGSNSISTTGTANVGAMNISQSITWDYGGSQIFEDSALVLQGAIGVAITSPGDAGITAGTTTWLFGADGTVTIPSTLTFNARGTNQRTGWAEALVFTKSETQKSISTAGGTLYSPGVERLVIAGGDSYQDPDSGVFAPWSEGGDIYLWAGRGADGGDIKVDAGLASGVNGEPGGTIKIRGGGSTSGTGGFVHIESGSGNTNGEIRLTTPGHTWTFGPDGVLQFPNGDWNINQQRYGMGNLVAFNDSGWTLGEYNGSNYGTEGMRIAPGIEGANELILPSDNNSATQSVQLNNYSTGGVRINSNGNTWTFAADGTTTLPGWTFGTDGAISTTDPLVINVPNGVPTSVANWNGQGGWNQGFYSDLATAGGTGSGLTVDVAANGGGYINITAITIHTPGSGYTNGDVITITNEYNLFSTFTIGVAGHNSWAFGTNGTTTIPGPIVTQYGNIESGTIGPGVTITANVDAGQYFNGLFVGNTDNREQHYVYVDPGQVVVGVTNTGTNQNYEWTFNDNASLNMPGGLNLAGNINFTASPAGAITGASLISAQEFYSSGNVTVAGNLVINGNATTVATQNLIVNDNIIYMANANPANSLDIGFAGHFNNGTYQHTGLVRQASTGQWKLFSNIAAEPSNTLDFSTAVYDDIQVGNITSPTITNLYSNAAAQANSIAGANAAIVTANTAMKSYVDAVSTAWTANAATQQTSINSINSNVGGFYTWANTNFSTSSYSNTNVTAYLAGNITAGNIGLGHVQFHGLDNSLTTDNGSKISVNSRLDVTGSGVGIGMAVTNLLQANGGLTVSGNSNATAFYGSSYNWANGVSILTGIGGTYSNANVASYLTTQTFYSNSNVASYLPTSSVITGINANVTAANAAIVTANTAMKSYVDSQIVSGSTTGNITFSGYTISTKNDPYGAVGITLNPANGGEIHIDSYTGINNNNPGYWLHIGDGSIGAVNNTGNVSIDFNDGTDSARGSAILDWAWWDSASNGNNNRGTGPHTHFGIYKNDDTHNTAWLEFDAITGNANIGNIRPTGIYTNNYFYANGAAFTSSNYGNTQANALLSSNTVSTINTTGNIKTIANVISPNYLFANGVNILSTITAVANLSNLTGNISWTAVGATPPTFTIASNGTKIVLWPSISSTMVDYAIGIEAGNTWFSVPQATNNFGYKWYAGNTAIATLSGNGTLTTGNITTTGNVSATNFVGNGAALTNVTVSIAGNVVGPQANVGIVAGSYNWTFDNTGNVTLPAGGDLVFSGNTSLTSISNGNITIDPNGTGQLVVTAITPATFGNTLSVTGTVTSLGNTNGTAFAVVGNGAASNVALGFFPTGNTPAEMAIRDYSTANSTMYFDTTIGSANTGGSFRFRSSNAFTTLATINTYGVVQPTKPGFRVYGSGTTTNLTTTVNTNGILTGNNWAADYNQGSYLNSTTGIFTAPVAGLYSAHLVARVSNTASAQIAIIKNYATTANIQAMWEAGTNCTANHFGVSTVAKLAAGDTLVIKVLLGQINFDSNDSWAVAYLG